MLCVIIGCAAGCRRDHEPSVVLYVSADEHIARAVIDAFEKESGIHVLMVGDTEAKKTAGLVERLRQEKGHPQADVFWSSEVFMTIELANEGVFESHRSPATANWPKHFCDEDGRWYGFGNRARVIAYSPDRIAVDDIPKTWMDLTKDRFKGRIVMADPRFGTTGGHLGAMKAWWDRHVIPGYFAAFADGLAANRVRLLPSGNAGVVEAIAKGEADLGLTDTDDVWAAQARGLPVSLVYPDHSTEPGASGIGTLLIPNTVAVVKCAQHLELARRLADFLLSESVERMLAQSESHNMPVRSALASEFSKYAVPNPLDVDYKQAAAARAPAIKEMMRAIEEHADAP